MRRTEQGFRTRRTATVVMACLAVAVMAIAPSGAAAKQRTVKKTAFFYYVAPVLPTWQTTEPRDPSNYQHVVNSDAKSGAMTQSSATKRGVYVKVRTEDLTPGNAYTAWLGVFPSPEECSGISPQAHSPDGDLNGFKCNDYDEYAASGYGIDGLGMRFAPGVLPSAAEHFASDMTVFYLAGGIADAQGRLKIGNHVWKRQKFGGGQLAAGAGTLRDVDTLKAEYQVTLLDHGPYDPKLKDPDGRDMTQSMMPCNGPKGRCVGAQATGADAGFFTGAFGFDEIPPPQM